MTKKIAAVLATAMLSVASAALASDTPKGTWLKAKCALCHGEDGAGTTQEGKKRNVPDLRAQSVQKKSDAELKKLIVDGHSKMPGFGALTQEQIGSLVIYIRSIAPPPAKK